MQEGFFYFVKDEFFKKYDTENKLVRNKEGVHNRPCFFAFKDSDSPEIFWCVPISSQVEKYRKIVDRKIHIQVLKGIKNPQCDTILFAYVLGQERAFLIQNMFPLTYEYMANLYEDKQTHNPVTISRETQWDIVRKSQKILKLVERGFTNLVFSDVLKIKAQLLSESILNNKA